MFAHDIVDWLEGNATAGSRAYLKENEAETRALLREAGLSPESAIGEFYLKYGADSVRGWYELVEIDQVADATEYAREELGVPARFVALSGTEGQGIVLYDTASHAVFDVEFGQFEALASGTLAPVAGSFLEFLRWCMNKQRGA